MTKIIPFELETAADLKFFTAHISVIGLSGDHWNGSGTITSLEALGFEAPHVLPLAVPHHSETTRHDHQVGLNHPLIVTNAHVAGDASQIIIKTAYGTEYQCFVAAINEKTDLAVLYVAEPNGDLHVMVPGSSAHLADGAELVAVGSPMGEEQGFSLTAGTLSCSERYTGHSYLPSMQVDVPINPGNSGGPMFCGETGQWVGVNYCGIMEEDGGNIGVNFTMRIEAVVDDIHRMIALEGTPIHMLPVSLASTNYNIARIFGVKAGRGMVVASTTGLKHAPWLKLWDVLLEVNGQEIKNGDNLSFGVYSSAPDKPVPVRLQREGEILELEVSIPRTIMPPEHLPYYENEAFGITVVPAPLGTGVVVAHVRPNSYQERHGMMRHTYITKVMGDDPSGYVEVQSPEHFYDLINGFGNKPFLVQVKTSVLTQAFFTMQADAALPGFLHYPKAAE